MKDKSAKMKNKTPNLIKDMKEVTSDPRFKDIGSNLMLRYMPKHQVKVKIDDRFSGLKNDNRFYEKSTMDPRGRKGNFSTKDDLNRFYSMSETESSSDDDDEDDNDLDESEEETNNKSINQSTVDSDSDDESSDVEDEDAKKKKKKLTKKSPNKDKNHLKKKRNQIEKDSPSKSNVSLMHQDQEDEDFLVKSSGKKGSAKSKLKKIMSSEDIEKASDDNEDDIDDMERTIRISDDKEISVEMKENLLKYDYSRGEAMFTDSSDDSSSTDDDEEEENMEEFDWGELDKDAVWENEDTKVDETYRFAVCNQDWDRINCSDLMVLFSSNLPTGGKIVSVKIYLSEFGKERLAEENRAGPKELLDRVTGAENYARELKDLEKLEKGELANDKGTESRAHLEAVRRYQRNRLKYYYAVVECDCVETSAFIYKEYDRFVFEGSSTILDLRYIPDDMTFEDEPTDVCEKVSKNYEMKDFKNSALHDSVPKITWDETNPQRRKHLSTAMTQITKGKEIDYDTLEAYIAPNSEDETDDEETLQRKNERSRKLKAFLREVDEEQEKRKQQREKFEEVGYVESSGSDDDGDSDQETDEQNNTEDSNSEEEANIKSKKNPKVDKNDVNDFISMVSNLKDEPKKKMDLDFDKVDQLEIPEEKTEIKTDNKTKSQKLTPFEKLLEKRKNKRLKKQQQQQEGDDSDSDEDIPDDLRDDPFFAEELKKRNKSKKKKEAEEESDDASVNEDLSLLVMEEEENDKKHFSMREIIHESKPKKKKRRFEKKKSKQEITEEKEQKKETNKFNVELDSRFNTLITSSEFHIDPTHPNFKKTDGMEQIIDKVNKKRFRNDDIEEMPSPSKKQRSSLQNDPEINKLVNKLKSKSKLKKR